MKLMTATEQKKMLARIEERRKILENSVVSVAKGFTSALFVWGSPGLGKSHLLTVMLDGIAGSGWRHHTAHSTPKALFQSLHENPNAIHLYEDCEKLLKTDLSASILRAACGAPNERQRWVTYETANEQLRFSFTGGIIIATNANVSRTNGPLQGVASRFRPIRWEMTLPERIATILKMSDREWVKNGIVLTEKECRKVAVSLIEMCTASNSDKDLDLRLFAEHALPAYAQSKQDSSMKWEDLLQAKLMGVATTMEDTQVERSRHLQQLAQKIDAEGGNTKAKIAKWKELTDLGQAIYYRHLREGKSAGKKK
jgi:hypothetical protein